MFGAEMFVQSSVNLTYIINFTQKFSIFDDLLRNANILAHMSYTQWDLLWLSYLKLPSIPSYNGLLLFI